MKEFVEFGRERYLDPDNDISGPQGKNLFTLFRLSFPFSQGSPQNHVDILEWIVREGYLSDIVLHDYAPKKIKAIVAPPLHDRYGTKAMTDDFDTIDRWRTLRWHLATTEFTRTIEELLLEISDKIIDSDIKYQYTPRPGRPELDRYEADSAVDPHMSFIRKYTVFEAPTGHSAYDKLLHQAIVLPLAASSKLRRLADLYELNHPGVNFFS